MSPGLRKRDDRRQRCRLSAVWRRRWSAPGTSRASAPARTPFDLFIAEDGAYTTVASAVSILVVLSLAFSVASATWALSRAGDVQVAADVTALAGSNTVASYHTAATVLDACVLSLGLTGMVVAGAGMVGTLIPPISAESARAVEAGVRMLKTRNEFAASASKGLCSLDRVLPYLVAANGTRACAAQASGESSFSGTALAVPRASDSDFPALEGQQIDTGALEDAATQLDDAAAALKDLAEESEQKKRAAWMADCGREGRNMQERAASLTALSAPENPDYASSISWSPSVGLERARSYYRWRIAHENPAGEGVEARADSAARLAFYRFALDALEKAEVAESGEGARSTIPLLPKNTDEVRGTSLFTDALWPSTIEEGRTVLHFDESCPGATGQAGPSVSFASMEGGAVGECPTCRFGVGDVGKAPAASTSIDNGFEYHLREFTLALDEYVDARQREIEAERRAGQSAERAGSSFEEAIAKLGGRRPRIAPPGRYGCVAVVVAREVDAPAGLDSSFAASATVPQRGAIAAAVLARDAATRENNTLSVFLSGLEERVSADGVAGAVGDLMDFWGSLLVSYGDLSNGLNTLADRLIGDMGSLGMGPVASFLGDRVRGVVRALDLEPVDLSLKKPVLTDSAHVLAHSDVPALAEAQQLLRRIPVGTDDPRAVLRALDYEVEEYIGGLELTVATIPVPGGGSVPITIDMGELLSRARSARRETP